MPRINFLFVLIIFLTACTPNATLVPLPTVTSSPVVIETATIAVTPIPDPISPENMELLNKAGYTYHDNQLFVYGTNRILTLEGNEWVDEMGERFKTDELQLIETNSKVVDARGELRDVLILKREIAGVEKIFLPLLEQWQEPLDVAASQKIIDPDNGVVLDRLEDFKPIDLSALPEITWADITSGRLLLSELLAIRPWPANVRVPTLQYMRLSMMTNVWTVSEYPDNLRSETMLLHDPSPDAVRPILWENDGVRAVSAFRMKDPITGKPMIIKGQQYLFNGYNVVLHMGYSDALGDPSTSESVMTQMALTNPPWQLSEPVVNIKGDNSDYCGKGGLGNMPEQFGICALQGYGGLPTARSLLPNALEQMIAPFDTGIQLTTKATETYPVGNEIFGLQDLLMASNSFSQTYRQVYTRPEIDPYFDTLYPDP